MISEFSGDFLQWLRGFYYTAQTGSLSAAAEKMNRSQPALTYQIKNLEKELGVRLFSGAVNKKDLTRDGKFLYKKAVEVFRLLDAISEEIGRQEDEVKGELSILSSYVTLQCYLPPMLAEFARRHPQVHFRVAGGRQLSLYEKIFSREFDLAVLCVDNVPPEFLADTLFASDLVLISPRHGKLAVPELPTLEEVASLPFIAHPDKSSLWPLLRSQFGKFGLSLQSRHEVSHFDALKSCVEKGMGVGIVDGFVCSREDREQLNVVPLTAYFPARHFGVIRRYDAFGTELEERFLEFLRASATIAHTAALAESDVDEALVKRDNGM